MHGFCMISKTKTAEEDYKKMSDKELLSQLREARKDPEFIKYARKLFKYHTGQIHEI